MCIFRKVRSRSSEKQFQFSPLSVTNFKIGPKTVKWLASIVLRYQKPQATSKMRCTFIDKTIVVKKFRNHTTIRHSRSTLLFITVLSCHGIRLIRFLLQVSIAFSLVPSLFGCCSCTAVDNFQIPNVSLWVQL